MAPESLQLPTSAFVSPRLRIAMTIMFVFVAVIYSLRIFARVRPAWKLGSADYSMTVAMILTATSYIIIMSDPVLSHSSVSNESVLGGLNQFETISAILGALWIWSITFIKISIVLMFLNMWNSMLWRMLIYVMIIINLFAAVAYSAESRLECKDKGDEKEKKGYCWLTSNHNQVLLFTSALFAFTNVTTAILPLICVTKIQRPLREKIIITLLMVLGLVASACGVVKAVLVYAMIQADGLASYGLSAGNQDIIAIWTYSEIFIGITVGNVPYLKPLFGNIFHSTGRLEQQPLPTSQTAYRPTSVFQHHDNYDDVDLSSKSYRKSSIEN
ncbi:hypothetical protein BT63DRAFT_480534 [Microthyrium microscopicum]|uniref:Rhodopsin domain-containing protein n=1 Tax=Microthyrium microscopicum TaxID=703497 RepID=A0A6A6U5M2_9PEZI|nr:hypothetical protein BT63DRAFT_480534 [Microthyrium microscopicum]